MTFEVAPDAVLARLEAMRAHDAPTRGGTVLSYVYDSGVAEIDALAEEAARRCLHLNGLDPVVFGSIAQLEREVVAFVRDLLHGDDRVVGTVTSGGTESILLATIAAAAVHPEARRIVAPATRHPAWRKAAQLTGLELDIVPVDADGVVDPDAMAAALGPDVALVIASAPSYPTAMLDPIEAIAAACATARVDLHVDACIGGLALPFWPEVAPWDLGVPGVTSISADLHKYAYAPKGASVLLTRRREQRAGHYFADVEWPGYPVVTSTLLGSRQPAGLAAAWAILTGLGTSGLQSLMDSCARSTRRIADTVQGVDGLRVVGDPCGPLLALAADDADEADGVDPLALVDGLRARGFLAQSQPGLRQPHGPRMPATAHLTITPALEQHLDELCAAIEAAAADARGHRAPGPLLTALGSVESGDPAAVLAALQTAIGSADAASFTAAGADLFDLIGMLPPSVTETLMIKVLAAHLDPR